jgi:hypothetical protein
VISLTLGSNKIQTSQCYDVIFTSDPDGNNILPFEREQCMPSSGNITAWVRVSSVNGSSHSSGTPIYVFYGNPSATTDSSNKTRVWTANYQWVLHLSDDAANTTVTDSATNSTGTSLNNINTSTLYTASGQVAGGFVFDGSTDGIRYGGFTVGTTSTVSAWLKPTLSSGTQNIVANGNTSGLFVDSGKLAYYDGTSYYHSNTSLTVGAWNYVVAVQDGTNILYYVNGGTPSTISNKTVSFNPSGTSNASVTKFAGTIDEIRVSNTNRSADWIKAEYNNQFSPSTFYNPGSEIGLGVPGGPTISSLLPTVGPVGGSVIISGSNFGSTQGTLMFNGVQATVSNWGPTSIIATVPSGATTGNVVVIANQAASNRVGFTVTPAGYQFTRTITIDQTEVTSDLQYFPALVSLTLGSGKIQTSQCYDLIFTSDAAGGRILPFEREQCAASSGTITAWVQIPLVSHSSGTPIYMFYGNSSVTTDPSNKTGVWDANYQLVQHQSDNAANTVVSDSTSKGNNGTSINSVNTSSLYTPSGKIAGGFQFNGSTDGILYANLPVGTTSTISMWLNTSSSAQVSQNLFAQGAWAGLYTYQGKLEYYDGSNYYDSSQAKAMSPGSWYYVVAVEDGTNITFYINGAPDLTFSGKAFSFSASSTSGSGSFDKFTGTMDEVRLSNIPRSAAWIAAEYNNQLSPSTFYNPGSEIGLGTAGSPRIGTLSPTSGPVGAPVTIYGIDFGTTQGTSTVTFNGTQATVSSWGPNSITTTVPSGATTGNVVVTVGGVASIGVTFTVVPVPSITNLSPSSGPMGQSVIITGSNFGATQGASTVTFNGILATVTAWGPGSITALVPSGATSGPVVVTVGVASNGFGFTVTAALGITGLSKTSGQVGAWVLISGSAFGATQGTSTVTFGGIVAAVSSWGSSNIGVSVPAGVALGNISVMVTVNGVPSNSVNFTVVVAPNITNLSQNNGLPGDSITITGNGFGASQGGGQVWLGSTYGVVQSPTNWSDTQIVAQVATGSTTGTVQVLQNGLWSNAPSFTVNTPHITGVSPNSAGPGTSVTISGTGFGSSQGNGTVWLGSTAGQVVNWNVNNNGQIVAAVASNALSGIVRVQQNGVWSNALPFNVPAPNSVTLVPNLLNLVVGDTHTIQALNAANQPVTGLTWTSSDPTVVSLSTDDPPVLTALAIGHITITAGSASTDVTVSVGPLSLGTVLWSNPGPATGVAKIVPAVPSPSGVADVFAFDQTNCSPQCTVQAITSDGTTAWTASLAAAVVVLPDFQGGLVAAESSTGQNGNLDTIVKLDGITGQPYPAYKSTSPAAVVREGQDFFCTFTCEFVAIHTDGTIFDLEFSNLAPNGNSFFSVVGIDPTSGTQKFSVRINVPMIGASANIPVLYGIMVAGDGYAYVPYAYDDDSGAHLAVLRVDSSGNSNTIPIKDFGTFIDIFEGFLWPAMITNADQGILLTWGNFSASPTEYGMATTTGTSVSLSVPQIADQGLTLNPVLQAQDGSFVGTVDSGSGSLMVAFDQSGNVRWTVPNEQPQIAADDGGVIGQSGIMYDASGNAVGQLVLPTYSWQGYAYQDGPVDQVVAAAVYAAGSWWPFLLANSSANTTAQEPWFVGLVDCQFPNQQCQQHGWAKATGGPNEWIHNGLKSLLTLLKTPCDPIGTISAKQACNIDIYVFTSNLKDANGTVGTRTAFTAYLAGTGPLNSQYPSFYDGVQSYLKDCKWTGGDGCVGTQHLNFIANDAPNASTIIFDSRTPPKIPRLRTFFRSAHIFPELLGVPEPNNMATIFHEALHAYTRLQDQASLFNFQGPSLKKALGCTEQIGAGTYDISAYLLQFTTLTSQQVSTQPQPCSTFFGAVAPPDPKQ